MSKAPYFCLAAKKRRIKPSRIDQQHVNSRSRKSPVIPIFKTHPGVIDLAHREGWFQLRWENPFSIAQNAVLCAKRLCKRICRCSWILSLKQKGHLWVSIGRRIVRPSFPAEAADSSPLESLKSNYKSKRTTLFDRKITKIIFPLFPSL